MYRIGFVFTLITSFCCCVGCKEKKPELLTPWGTPMEQSIDSISVDMSLSDIVNNGELIMLTLTGPENYYDYHGHGMGTQYLLCEKFTQTIGVALRVEVCRDTTEMIQRLERGEGDIIACALPMYKRSGLLYAGVTDRTKGTSWAVERKNKELADTLNKWFKPGMLAEVKKQESWMLSTASITRHVYSPMLDRGKGVISNYDHLFQKYAPIARWDWRLLAAQCYQESTFDPKAHSWAGACGLMQIMPSTAEMLGLSHDQLYEPEPNIAAAARYISQINAKFQDVPNRMERISFVLASYNGGYSHVRDAMALAKKYGKDQYRWVDVGGFILRLSDSKFYNDPVVKYGYMRGSETYDYVQRIQARWNEYRGISSGAGFHVSPGVVTPQRATKKYKYHV
ncbi:tail length tape measure protein [Prevotella sp. oral taxon 376]|uniref:transglycosylase SLT domain-containing protein n=1 Tax=Prevotella sp. oral taxon 376 TaxID=712466 RepID=UPI000D1E8E92|nr:transglycosylase SLT domain-containing protein [Prevotella sp. oral taxon 376]PTL32705.1 tail length tape measure protein [Prevotella sp. oral taxon 376]